LWILKAGWTIVLIVFLSLSLSLSLQGVVLFAMLDYVETPEDSSVTHGIGLAFAFFTAGFSWLLSLTIMTALNHQAAIRIKGAFHLYAYKTVIGLRGQAAVSIGEV